MDDRQVVTLTDNSRIHIVGGPGSGKSTLAYRLGLELGTRSYKLDEIAYEPTSGAKQPLSFRDKNIEIIVSRSRWITEGVYLWWTDQLFQKADVIVWLDLPMHVAMLRKFPHHLKRTLMGGYPHAGMRNQIDHTLFMWSYYRSQDSVGAAPPAEGRNLTRRATIEALAPFKEKVVRCQTRASVDALYTGGPITNRS